MKSIGNNIVAATLFSLAAVAAQADNVVAPELTTFTAGTPAKAAEVNGNFSELKTYGTELNNLVSAQAALIETLETKIAGLENSNPSDEFTIEVKSDGELIGYTNQFPTVANDFVLVKTNDNQMFTIKKGTAEEYSMSVYNKKTGLDSPTSPIFYTDDTCSAAVFPISKMTFTAGNSSVQEDAIFNGGELPGSQGLFDEYTGMFFMSVGTNIIKTDIDIYLKFNESLCRNNGNYLSSIYYFIPVEKVNLEDHGIKSIYTNITIDGYSNR